MAKKGWEFENLHVTIVAPTCVKPNLHCLMPHSKLNSFLKNNPASKPINFHMNVSEALCTMAKPVKKFIARPKASLTLQKFKTSSRKLSRR